MFHWQSRSILGVEIFSEDHILTTHQFTQYDRMGRLQGSAVLWQGCQTRVSYQASRAKSMIIAKAVHTEGTAPQPLKCMTKHGFRVSSSTHRALQELYRSARLRQESASLMSSAWMRQESASLVSSAFPAKAEYSAAARS